jgi:hypothetical protein
MLNSPPGDSSTPWDLLWMILGCVWVLPDPVGQGGDGLGLDLFSCSVQAGLCLWS